MWPRWAANSIRVEEGTVALSIRQPSRNGLYEPFYEHDACGVGFVANLSGDATHTIIRQGIQVLENLEHRGACGCDPETGDGAGMLLQLPHALFAREAESLKFSLPKKGEYAAGMMFLPTDAEDRRRCVAIIEKTIADDGQAVLGWREVPRNSACLGFIARESEPVMMQVFIGRAKGHSWQ